MAVLDRSQVPDESGGWEVTEPADFTHVTNPGNPDQYAGETILAEIRRLDDVGSSTVLYNAAEGWREAMHKLDDVRNEIRRASQELDGAWSSQASAACQRQLRLLHDSANDLSITSDGLRRYTHAVAETQARHLASFPAHDPGLPAQIGTAAAAGAAGAVVAGPAGFVGGAAVGATVGALLADQQYRQALGAINQEYVAASAFMPDGVGIKRQRAVIRVPETERLGGGTDAGGSDMSPGKVGSPGTDGTSGPGESHSPAPAGGGSPPGGGGGLPGDGGYPPGSGADSPLPGGGTDLMPGGGDPGGVMGPGAPGADGFADLPGGSMDPDTPLGTGGLAGAGGGPSVGGVPAGGGIGSSGGPGAFGGGASVGAGPGPGPGAAGVPLGVGSVGGGGVPPGGVPPGGVPPGGVPPGGGGARAGAAPGATPAGTGGRGSGAGGSTAAGAGRRAAGGMMPMGAGAGRDGEEKPASHHSWLVEDDDPWGVDEIDVPPGVIK